MATTNLNFAGYFFGVENEAGEIIEYPTYNLAVEALEFWRLDGRKRKLVMQARYVTPWEDAKEPEREPE